MRLLRLAHSIWDHSVVVLCFSGLCLPRFRGRPCPGLVGSLLAFSDPGSQSYVSSHCFTCKTGFAQINEDGYFWFFSLAFFFCVCLMASIRTLWLKAVSAQTSLISCHNCDWGDNLVFFDPFVFVTFVILVS